MPLPESHLRTLNAYIHYHIAELNRLRSLYDYLSQEIQRRSVGEWRDPNPKPYGIPGLQAEVELVARMIKTHESLLALARDDRSQQALAELLESPESAQQAARDPKRYAQERGIELPPALDVECTVRRRRILVRLDHYDRFAPFSITWTNDGFEPPPNPDGTDVEPGTHPNVE